MRLIRNAGSFALATLALAALGGAVLVGCGGGSGTVTKSTKPSATTRSRVTQLHSQSVRALAQSGVQPLGLAAQRNGSYGIGSFPTPPAGFGGTAWGGVAGYTPAVGAPAQFIAPFPMIGAFIHNVAAKSGVGRAAVLSHMANRPGARTAITRGAPGAVGGGSGSGSAGTGTTGSGTTGGPMIPAGGFYYDDFLGLWVQIDTTATQTTFTLYVDQAKTQPAGSIVTTIPSGTTFPQVYGSTYSFTAGLMAGAHGAYQTTQNADNSGMSTYNDTYPDSSADSGTSSWSGVGDYTWSNQDTDATGAQTTSTGTFHADGSGMTHATTSDGYVIDYTYNADGSGHGRISGPAAGLPATITWDVYGDTTITYADGTVDYTPGWINSGGTVTPVLTPATPTNSDTPPAPPVSSTNTPPPPPGH